MIAEIRDAIAAAITDGTGLRAYGRQSTTINAPCAHVGRPAFDPRFVFSQAKAVYPFQIKVYVPITVERAAQLSLDEYCDLTGAKSITAAVQNSDLWPDDLVDSVAVTNIGEDTPVSIAGADYLMVVFDLEVTA